MISFTVVALDQRIVFGTNSECYEAIRATPRVYRMSTVANNIAFAGTACDVAIDLARALNICSTKKFFAEHASTYLALLKGLPR